MFPLSILAVYIIESIGFTLTRLLHRYYMRFIEHNENVQYIVTFAVTILLYAAQILTLTSAKYSGDLPLRETLGPVILITLFVDVIYILSLPLLPSLCCCQFLSFHNTAHQSTPAAQQLTLKNIIRQIDFLIFSSQIITLSYRQSFRRVNIFESLISSFEANEIYCKTILKNVC